MSVLNYVQNKTRVNGYLFLGWFQLCEYVMSRLLFSLFGKF